MGGMHLSARLSAVEKMVSVEAERIRAMRGAGAAGLDSASKDQPVGRRFSGDGKKADAAGLVRAPQDQLVVADIGTDHAFLPIALYQTGVADACIAADIGEGPLARANEHIKAAGLSGKIATRLSDGLAAFFPNEADIFTVCGMGGELILHILDTASKELLSDATFICGPQSKLYELRRGLRERKLMIMDEELVEEDGKFYPILCVRAVKSMEASANETGDEAMISQVKDTLTKDGKGILVDCQKLCDRYGGRLLLKRHEVLRTYLLSEQKRLSNIMVRVEGDRKLQITEEIQLLDAALCFFVDFN